MFSFPAVAGLAISPVVYGVMGRWKRHRKRCARCRLKRPKRMGTMAWLNHTLACTGALR